MQISLTLNDVERRAKLYKKQAEDDKLSDVMIAAKTRGHMTINDLVEVAKWKWRGAIMQKLVKLNSPEDVIEISKVAFSTTSERLKIGALLSLSGVEWPMASVILHFAFSGLYPILDVRAMKTVGGSAPYNLQTWLEYTDLCRKKIDEYGITMRQLDRALWAENSQ